MYQRYNPRSQATAVRAPSLLGQVLGITASGFVVTAAAAHIFANLSYGLSFAAMLLGFGLLLGMRGAQANPSTALAMFYGFTVCEGAGIGPVIARYAHVYGSDIVASAALTTGLGMAILAAVVYATGIDFTRYQGIAMGALLALIVISLINAFVHFVHPEIYDWAALAIFSFLVLIDFARIRQVERDYPGQGGALAIFIATSIYLDAINIFMILLNLLGVRSRDD